MVRMYVDRLMCVSDPPEKSLDGRTRVPGYAALHSVVIDENKYILEIV